MDNIVPCIICGKQLEQACDSPNVNQPMNGLAFESYGHWGSDFDPMDGTKLEIAICSECLNVYQDRIALFESMEIINRHTFKRYGF